MTNKCETCGEGKDPMSETATAWQCNDCEQWNPNGETGVRYVVTAGGGLDMILTDEGCLLFQYEDEAGRKTDMPMSYGLACKGRIDYLKGCLDEIAQHIQDDQRLDGTSADAAAYRRNSWMFG